MKIVFFVILVSAVASAQSNSAAQSNRTANTSGANNTITGTAQGIPNKPGHGAPSSPAVNNMSPADTSNASGATSSNTLLTSDAEIAQVLVTINESEITAARLALKRAQSAQVKEFAQTMLKEHKDNIKKTESVQKKLSKSTTSRLLTDEAKMRNGHLKESSGADFDRAYVASQIAMHEKAFTWLNDTLLPGANSPELKAHLQATRDAVANHLKHARDLQTALK